MVRLGRLFLCHDDMLSRGTSEHPGGGGGLNNLVYAFIGVITPRGSDGMKRRGCSQWARFSERQLKASSQKASKLTRSRSSALIRVTNKDGTIKTRDAKCSVGVPSEHALNRGQVRIHSLRSAKLERFQLSSKASRV